MIELKVRLISGVHPPEAMMHFPPCFRFSPIFEKFSESVENFQNFTFSSKISDDFFYLSTTNFEFPPCFSTFPPCFAKIIISPFTFTNCPPVLGKFICFLHALCVFRFPPTLTMMHLCITQCTYWTPLRLTEE